MKFTSVQKLTQKLGIIKLKANHQWCLGGWFSCRLIAFSHDWSLLETCQSRKVTFTCSRVPHHTQLSKGHLLKSKAYSEQRSSSIFGKKLYSLNVLVLRVECPPNNSRQCDDSDCNRSLKCWKEVRKWHYPKPKSDKYRSLSHGFNCSYAEIIHYELTINIILILGIISSYNEKGKNIMAIKLW